ncbi:serine protease [Rhodalgimonas zhirmunskyi]|uniref:serine protease n=1 Tax=Rhodalgimonas zhirmunskyi TaxID=2964767 RepID=UPI0029529412|nr:serine protease [Rhodoalgimonas zhirmunskyi]
MTAQEGIAWVQIEAQPSLNQAQERVRAYAARLPDVNGFNLGGGWYAIALGPYTQTDAQRVLRAYRADGEIPRDSYIAYSNTFRQQFWPVGANLLNLPEAVAPTESQAATPDPDAEQQAAVQVETQPEPQVEPQIKPADESPAEAQRSERALTREERMQLQEMLKWAGFYNAAIDGAFGRGTRGSMAEWQRANNFEVTGILTTAQRAELKRQYNAILDGIGLETVRDDTTGIEMMVPMGVVSFTKYSPPFAHFDAKNGDLPRVLLISQQGNQDTLYGLFDIMQTLAIVPENGPRERNRNGFVLVGENDEFISHTEARLENGEVKGFSLIWPRGDEERRTRLLSEMKASFTRTEGVMSPAAGEGDAQDIDLVSGLEIRRPKVSRSGFWVDGNGTVVTTIEAVAQCERITLDADYDAEVVFSDAATGIAILRPKEALSPAGVATLREGAPRLQSQIAVSGFSYEGKLTAPTVTYGTLSDVKGLGGETQLKRLALNALPGDEGGPVFDAGGSVMGMLLPHDFGTRKLPENVGFAIDADTVRAVLAKAGVQVSTVTEQMPIEPEDLTDRARDTTVLVSCW